MNQAISTILSCFGGCVSNSNFLKKNSLTAGHKAILTFRWGGLNEIVAPAQWGETGWVLGGNCYPRSQMAQVTQVSK